MSVVLLVVGLPTAGVGTFALRRRLDLALGGWTVDNADPDSFDQANRRIGTVLRRAGIAMGFCGLVVLVIGRTDVAIGVGLPVLGLGSLAIIIAAILGVASITPRV